MKLTDLNLFKITKNKNNNAAKLEFFKQEREMVRKASEDTAATVEVISAEDIAEVVETIKAVSPSGFVYRVYLPGAEDIYNAISERNYKKLVKGMGHLEEDEEFIAGMCLIDKCEEYGDFESMAEVFKVYEYVVRHKKASSPVITYARQYIIGIRMYLTELNML